MKCKMIFMLLWGMLLSSLPMVAQQVTNKIYIPEVECGRGKTINVAVALDNDSEIVALQFNLLRPSYSTLVSDSWELTDRKSDHVLSVRRSGKEYLFVVYSPTNAPLRGNSGNIINFSMKIPENWEVGNKYPFEMTEPILSIRNGDNVLTSSDPGALLVIEDPRPDVAVSDVKVDKSSYVPGEKIQVSWMVKNEGDKETGGGWSEQVSLVSDNGEEIYLGKVYYESILGIGGTVSRQAEFIISDLLGIDGTVKAKVKLVPGADLGELAAAVGNNIAQSEAGCTIAKKLRVELPTVAIEENNTSLIRCKLYRSGSWVSEQTFTLRTDKPERLDVPESVTIPAGQSGGTFYIHAIDNDILNTDSIVKIAIEGNGYEAITGEVGIVDNELPSLTLTSSKNELTEGENFTLTVERELVKDTPLIVYLTCDHLPRFSFPAQVVIPAGEKRVSIDVKTVDDDLPDVTTSAEFTASASRHIMSKCLVILNDNDLPEISLTITPETVSESAGPLAVMAVLRRLTQIDKKVTVKVTDNSDGELMYSSDELILEAGVTEVQFTIGVIDNATVDGDKIFDITAGVYISSCSCSADVGSNAGIVKAKLTVLDDDGPALKITSSATMLLEGLEEAAMLTITRNTSVDKELEVKIVSDREEDLEYAHTVIIPAGEQTINVPVTVKRNEVSGDDRTVVFTVSSDGYAKGICWAMITDQTLPDAKIIDATLSVSEVEVGGNARLNITVKNEGFAAFPVQSPINVYMSNTSSILTTMYTQEAIEPGQSTTVTKEIIFPNITGDYTLRTIVNEKQTVKELLYVNNSSDNIPIKILPAFTATVSVDKLVYKQGESVIINGKVSGNVTSNAEVEIYIINNGVRQTLSATTDLDGTFSIVWKPQSYEMGHFSVGACYPKEGLMSEQTAFDVYGLKRMASGHITCEALLNEAYQGEIELSNPGRLPLTGLSVEVLSAPENCIVNFEPVERIEGNATGILKYTITGNAVSNTKDWEQIKACIKSTEGATLDLVFYYYCRSPKGDLQASVSSINTTMIKGTSRDYSFTLINRGKGATGKISLGMSNIPWITLLTPKEMGSLGYGESATVILRLTPTDDMQLNVPLEGTLGINAENANSFPLDYRIEPVSESTGTFIVDVCDEYTYYTTQAPHVSGALVTVKHPTTGAIIAQGTTDEKGLFIADALPEGYYAVNVTADKHDSYNNTLLIDPGKETKITVNLSFQAIKVDWNVEETEVEDQYDIITTVKYETNVPMPVVEMSIPSKIAADELLAGESLIFYATLTNKGLITAKDVQLIMPDGFRTFKFEPVIEETFDLRPQESITIPVKVTKIVKRSRDLDNDPCIGYPGTLYFWDCGLDRKWHRYDVALQLGSCRDGIPPTPSEPKDNNVNPSPGGWPIFPNGGGGGGWYGGGPSSDGGVSTGGEDKGCEPCQNRFMYKMVKCGVTRIPIVATVIEWVETAECVYRIVDGMQLDSCVIETFLIPEWVDKIIGWQETWNECFVPLFEKCDPGNIKTKKRVILDDTGYPSYIVQYLDVIDHIAQAIQANEDQFFEIFGDSTWLYVGHEQLNIFWRGLMDWSNKKISVEQLQALKPLSISDDVYQRFVQRWENTLAQNGSDNIIDLEHINQCIDVIQDSKKYALSLGYSSILEMFTKEDELVMTRLQEASNSVCSSITLQFSQTMTMTRQAFRGTLTVFNGNETIAMQNVKLNVEVRDDTGAVATSHEFQINTENLDTFTGDLDGEWTLDANATGKATILFIPTKYAAQTVAKEYLFGGSLSYTDPFSGLTVTRELYPVRLTVKPSPNLDMTYFMQRDVWGDDPLTPAVVEPMIPAEFSLLIHNTGYGDATNVKMVTEQPKIVDNEKGLLIDFELLSSQLNGGEQTLALGGSVPTDFGTIPAQSTTFAQWWFQSSLLGHFTDYDVKATHVTSFGNEDLSLLGDVSIHELVRSLNINNADEKKMIGFLVNDIEDADDLPDMLYLGDGTIETVTVIALAECFKCGENTYRLKINPKVSGWNYGVIADPTGGKQKLASIVRSSDQVKIDLRNFWQTDRTLRDGKEHLYENRLHFVDKFGTDEEEYLLTFEPRPDVILEVESFTGIPANGTVAREPVKTIGLRFNKPIDEKTFTVEDLTLQLQGELQETSSVNITKVNEREFLLDISAVNDKNGYYVLTVKTNAITDNEGFTGDLGKRVDWVQYLDGLVQVNLKPDPVEGGTITPKSGQYEYGTSIKLNAVPNKGYDFQSWSVDGEVFATEPICDFKVNKESTLLAKFTPKHYEIILDYDVSGGAVSGNGTGIYKYGQSLTFVAHPFVGYKFEGWIVNEEKVDAINELTIEVKEMTSIEAIFTKIPDAVTVSYFLPTGWNWLSVNVKDDNLDNPVALLDPIKESVISVLGQTEDLVYDEQYGLYGSLTSFRPDRGYKMRVKEDVDFALKGIPFAEDEVTVTLNKGWNWMGYTPNVEMSVGTALENLIAEENDIIMAQDNFATYDGANWIGSLTTLTPGSAYLYYSNSVKSFNYPTGSSSKVASMLLYHASDGNEPMKWQYDKRKYADNMGIISKLYSSDGQELPAGSFMIGAFVGDECRGGSSETDGYQFITVHGESADAMVTFRAVNMLTGEEFNIKESIRFDSNVAGNLSHPVVLHLGSATGIEEIYGNLLIYPNPVKDRLFIRTDLENVKEIRIIDMKGSTVLTADALPLEAGLDVTSLTDGVYFITIETDTDVIRQKFIKSNTVK